MKLSGVEYQKLVESIVQAYPTKNDLAQIVMYSLEENIDAIVNSETTTQSIVFNLIIWVQARGKLKNLLEIISQERPDNVELQNTIKNLLEKYSQDNKINSKDDQDNHKKNKLSSFIKLFLGILIIPVGIMSYQISQQPRLSCNDTELQKQDDSIKIIISNFNGTNSQKLENYLYQKFNNQLTSKASKIIVCLTTNTKQKIRNDLEARELGKQLLPENDKQRDLALIIWLDESTLTGGIEFINDDKDIPLSYDLDVENNRRNILDDEFYKKVYLFTSLGLSKVFYYEVHNSLQSQKILQKAINNSINCTKENSNKILKNQDIANLYFELGLSYEDPKFQNFEQALESYKCALLFDDKDTQIIFQMATVYEIKDISKAKSIYTQIIGMNPVSSEIKSKSLTNRGSLLAEEKQCLKAEEDFKNAIDLDLSNGLQARAYSRFFHCQKFADAIADLEQLCQQIGSKECQDILRNSYKIQLSTLKKSQQEDIRQELEELAQSQPKWKQIISFILEH
jgi:Tfp pilus assembly protein PilF